MPSKEDAGDYPRTQEDLEKMESVLDRGQKVLEKWVFDMTRGDGTSWSDGKFYGHNSTLLNSELKRKQKGIARLKTQIRRLKQKLDPYHEEDHEPTKYEIMRGPVTLERQACGSFLSPNSDRCHEPSGVRCVHYQNGEYIPCDCRYMDQLYRLSERSKNLKRIGLLVLDERILDQQREAVAFLRSDEIVPNIFSGTRDFDCILWKHWSNLKKNMRFGNPTWHDLSKEMDAAKLEDKN